jgi:cellobiose transport system permease protein
MKAEKKSNWKPKLPVKRTPYYFIAPYLFIYIIFGLFPIFFSLYISLTDWNGIQPQRNFVGLENYYYLFFKDYYFLKSVGNTAIFMVGYIPLTMVAGLLLAAGLQSRMLRYKRSIQIATFMPYITTPIAVGLIFGFLFDLKYGIVNNVIRIIGLSEVGVNWLTKAPNLRVVIIVMLIWKLTGYQMVFFASGLANIPDDIYESAWVDGAKFRHTFFMISIPLLAPIFLFLTVTNIIGGFQLLEEPMMLVVGGTNAGTTIIGGPDRAALTTIWNMYDTAFGTLFKYGRGAAIAYSLFLFILVFSFIGYKITNRGNDKI